MEDAEEEEQVADDGYRGQWSGSGGLDFERVRRRRFRTTPKTHSLNGLQRPWLYIY